VQGRGCAVAPGSSRNRAPELRQMRDVCDTRCGGGGICRLFGGLRRLDLSNNQLWGRIPVSISGAPAPAQALRLTAGRSC
jgi:hypothetical protein